MQNIVAKTEGDSTQSDSVGRTTQMTSSNLSWEKFAVLVRAEAEAYITTAQLDALKSDLPRWQKVLLDLLEDAEDKLLAVQQITGTTRDQVVNDFEAELNTLAMAFQRLTGASLEDVPAVSVVGPSEPDVVTGEAEPCQLQLSWASGKIIAWAAGCNNVPESTEQVMDRLLATGAPKGAWKNSRPVVISSEIKAPALSAEVTDVLGWLVPLVKTPSEELTKRKFFIPEDLLDPEELPATDIQPELTGDPLGMSARWLSLVAIAAVELVAQGRTVPRLQRIRKRRNKKNRGDKGDFAVQWMPGIISQEKLKSFADSLPGAVSAADPDLDRTELNTEKTGEFTGAYAINPINGNKIPIWISDYVLITYGTGAIMAVPSHDTRDFEFAEKFDIPIVCIIEPDAKEAKAGNVCIEDVLAGKACWTGNGKMINSVNDDGLDINGMEVKDSKRITTEWLEERGIGKAAVNYKLRDWLFSRQRYWGEPFPVVHMEDGTIKLLPEDELPLRLPVMEEFKPSGTGESPLANATEWLEYTDPETGMKGRRETNTMPQWAGSCWYYLRYIDPDNTEVPWNLEKENYWMPVDLYVGGAEHAVLHLLYARFWHKVLYDIGVVHTKEPFTKLVNQGMILGLSHKDARGALVPHDNVEFTAEGPAHKETGEKLEEFQAKMSKSLKNVVNPDDIIEAYGADSMRLYEMFMGPLEATKPWNTKGVEGVYRFLKRAWRMIVCSEITDEACNKDQLRVMHATIKKVGDDIESFGFNTAISQMMIFVNEFAKCENFLVKLLRFS